MTIEKLSTNTVFGGEHIRFKHRSSTLACDMIFAVFLPSKAKTTPVPVLYWLSGLTCTDENFMQKAGAQQYAEKHGIAIVAPDTSPRGEDIANDPSYDLGQGAGFYVNATQPPWQAHYQMYSYVTEELPQLVEQHLPVSNKKAISGHSMGGHGALTIALKNKDMFTSISAFSPIVNPINCPWGQKAFTHYLGAHCGIWEAHDTCELMRACDNTLPCLIDQGLDDEFLKEQLLTERLTDIVKEKQLDVTIRMQPGYDHSYYFIASFIEEHVAFHAKYLAQ
ncbi:S-formylglutathione hydrolase [Thalassotalea agarivorans]|uniref:S-formylglutathione hydrolase n=1 Tax=Thalassotalea agarivorans TaxID=349064 RepID=A0A1H9ZEI8_THASX|nr:S-formylglutathione hydrolase [Thalassotalea agarivorans]SES80070.1 S-formylglutathione hydrolase [Thalassotalea agarivorans]